MWSLNLNVAELKIQNIEKCLSMINTFGSYQLVTIQTDIFYMKISMVWFVVFFKVTDTWRM